MNVIFLFINAFLPLVLSELQQYKVISPETSTLITGIEGAASSFDSMVKDSTTNTVTVTSLLTAILSAVDILQAQTPLNAKTLAIIAAFTKAANAGFAAAAAVTTVDPDALKPYVPMGNLAAATA
jgi:hypothetical protein